MAGFVHYQGRAVRWGFVKSAQKETPFVSVTFAVTEGPQRRSEFEWQGWLSAAALARTVQSLRLCGATLEGGDITDLSGIGSRVVDISVEETPNGPRVAFVNSLRKALTDEEKTKLAESLSGLVVNALDAESEEPFQEPPSAA